MKLVVDFGNTRTKIAVFKNKDICELLYCTSAVENEIGLLLKKFPDIQSCIYSSVTTQSNHFLTNLPKHIKSTHFTNKMPIPLKVAYESPETLGTDRLAAAIGSSAMFPEENVLCIQSGTCITYEMIENGRTYIGGAISPGIQMRFSALNTFTDKLPLIKHENHVELIGQTTQKSILSGVCYGVIAEVDGMIEAYKQRFKNLKVVVSGGDYNFFDKKLKNSIFAIPNIVLRGLNEILDFNEENN